MSLHEQLIDELLDGNVSLTERENAAKNEILALRAKLAEKAPTSPKKATKEPKGQAEVSE